MRSARSVDEILDAFNHLIDSEGYAAITTSTVAEAAVVSVGTVYRYYKSKPEIARAAAERNLANFSAKAVSIIVESGDSWAEILKEVVLSYAELHRSQPGFHWLQFGDVIDQTLAVGERSGSLRFAAGLADAFAQRNGMVASEPFIRRVEVVADIVEALVSQAFNADKQGDAFLIGECIAVTRDYLAKVMLEFVETSRR